MGGGGAVEWVLSAVPPGSHLEEPRKFPSCLRRGEEKNEPFETLSGHLHNKGLLSRRNDLIRALSQDEGQQPPLAFPWH